MKSTTIWVSEYVKKRLDEIKERNGHKSYDSVLRDTNPTTLFCVTCWRELERGEKCVENNVAFRQNDWRLQRLF